MFRKLLLLASAGAAIADRSPPSLEGNETPCSWCTDTMTRISEPFDSVKTDEWCEKSLNDVTYEHEEMKTFVSHVCASFDADSSLLGHVNTLKASDMDVSSVCGILGASDSPCTCPLGSAFLEEDVRVALNSIRAFASSVPSARLRFLRLGKRLLSRATLSVTGCAASNVNVATSAPRSQETQRYGSWLKRRVLLLPRARWSSESADPGAKDQGVAPLLPIPDSTVAHLSPRTDKVRSQSSVSATRGVNKMRSALKRARMESAAVRVSRIQCGELDESAAMDSNAHIIPEALLYKAKVHKDVSKVQDDFCNSLGDDRRKFSGFVVDIDLARTEMVVSEAKNVVPANYVRKCSDFKSPHCHGRPASKGGKCRSFKDPLFTTRTWMASDPSIAIAFNANFFDMSGDVHKQGSCHESLGLVLIDGKIWNAPERSEVYRYETDTTETYPREWLVQDIGRLCADHKNQCNVKGSVALIVDNRQGLAYVASNPTTKMIQALPCMKSGTCNGIAGNALIFDGHVMDSSQLNPDARKRARTAVGVKDNGRRLVVLVAERQRVDGVIAKPDLKKERSASHSLAMTGAAGATLDEMRRLCIMLDLKDCVNLDGGGSSTMMYQQTRTGVPIRSNIPEDKLAPTFHEYADRPATHHFGFRYRGK